MRQAGNSALGMVLMILLMGSITLHASREMLGQGMVLVADEQHFIQDYWRAQSALQWGLTLDWPASETLMCQQDERVGWRSCLQRGDEGEGLLKGEAIGSELALWHWVSAQGDRIEARPHGWIDYCPLSKPELCA